MQKTTSCTTSLFVYLRFFKELAFKSFVENGCKGKSYFRNHQIFQKVFSEKFFSGNFSAAVRSASPSGLTLSRSLAACKVRYSVQRLRQDIRLTLCHQNFISSVRFPLESGCKGTDFSETGKCFTTFFYNIFIKTSPKDCFSKR